MRNELNELLENDEVFTWVDEGAYLWTPYKMEPSGEHTGGEFQEIASGWHSGMDAIYSLHSYWVDHKFELSNEKLYSELENFKDTLDEALAIVETTMATMRENPAAYDADSEAELNYMQDIIEMAVAATQLPH